MFESIDLFTFILILLFVAIIVAIINFIIGVIITIRMASLKGLTEKKKPAILINLIWSIVLLLTGFSPWTYIIAFILNLTIGMIALKYDEFYGLTQFQKRLKFLLVILTVQFIISIVLYLIVFFLIVVYVLGW